MKYNDPTIIKHLNCTFLTYPDLIIVYEILKEQEGALHSDINDIVDVSAHKGRILGIDDYDDIKPVYNGAIVSLEGGVKKLYIPFKRVRIDDSDRGLHCEFEYVYHKNVVYAKSFIYRFEYAYR